MRISENIFQKRKIKALLINPPKGLEKIGQKGDYFYPYSLIYLMNYALKAGFKVDIYDLFMDPFEQLENQLKREPVDVIGITCHVQNRFVAIGLLKTLKTILPQAITVLGGKSFIGVGGIGKELIKKEPYLDVVVQGEGEITFVELLKAAEEKRSFEGINGLAYRDKKGYVIVNHPRKDHPKLDDFTIDYSNLPEKIRDRYSSQVEIRNFEEEGYRGHAMLLGRGCIAKCVFCTQGTGANYRIRSMEDCIEEIKSTIKPKMTNFYSFNDPSFCNRVKFVESFCETIIDEKLDIKWWCEARVDTPHYILELMKKAGCISLHYGVESGSPRVLKAINKKIDLNLVINFAKMLQNLEIRSTYFMMVSLPGEREEDAMLSLKLIKELGRYGSKASMAAAVIFPNTQLEKIAKKRDLIPKDFSWLDRTYFQNYKFSKFNDCPSYIEHLSPRFIENFLDEYQKVAFSRLTVAEIVKKSRKNLGKMVLNPKFAFSKGIDYIRYR